MSMSSESARITPVITKSEKALVQRAVRLLREGLAIPIPPKDAPALPARKTGFTRTRASVQDLMPRAKAIARAYTKELKSYRELAQQYNCTLPTIQALLLTQHVAIRTPGRVLGKENDGGEQQLKVSPVQRQWMLQQDLAGMPHSEIAVVLGVSRERVRQLCNRAGHTPRRQRQRSDREATTLAAAGEQVITHRLHQDIPPSTETVTASMLWTRGDDIVSIAKVLKRNPNSLGVQINRWRKRWPSMFATRYRKHAFK